MWIIAQSRIHGRGVIVTRPVASGTNLGIAHWVDGLDGVGGVRWRTTDLGKFHNHSTAPTAHNVRIANCRYLVALRDLFPGEEVTIDYRLQPDLEQPKHGWR